MADDRTHTGRQMTGFLDTLTDEQLKAAMEYRGEDNHPASADEQQFETMSEQQLLDGLDKMFGHLPAKFDGDPAEWKEGLAISERALSDANAEIARQAKVITRMQDKMSAMAMDWSGTKLESRIAILEDFVRFAIRWTWHKEGNGTSDSERLGCIKHHPTLTAFRDAEKGAIDA